VGCCVWYIVYVCSAPYSEYRQALHVESDILCWINEWIGLDWIGLDCPGLYLPELCTPVAQVAERQHLRSASRHLLVVPKIQLDTYGRRAFAVVGPTIWNALGNDLRDPDLSIASFGSPIENALVTAVFGALSALEALCDNAMLYKLTLTLTLTLGGITATLFYEYANNCITVISFSFKLWFVAF